MIEHVVTVFVASVLGSLHCAGMCGAFVLVAVGADGRVRTPVALHASYHLGRLTTYATLGVIAGSLGGAIDLGGQIVGWQQAASIIAGVSMIVFGGIALLRLHSLAPARLPIPASLQRLSERGHRAAMEQAPVVRASLIGLLTTLLPCGWLYLFVLVAMGTGSGATGALSMGAFWLGTLPVMGTIGFGAAAIAGRFGRALPHATVLAVIAIGIWTIVLRPPLSEAMLGHNMASSEPRLQSQTMLQAARSGAWYWCHER
ncbi:MAG: sulfite exporter TauE/SafE family protein [Planctomycetota bacterium]|jgi:sulfite exporter TauE/SafE